MIALVALGVLGTALVSTAAPLLTYSLTLAVFGLAHVLYELRYVTRRFGPELSARLRWGLVALLAGVVLVRVGRLRGWWDGPAPTRAELGLVLAMAGLVLPPLWRAGRAPFGIGLALWVAGGLGLLISPVLTLFTLAMAHNWTPVGFLMDALRGEARRRALGACALVLGVVPLVIASGLPLRGLAALGWYLPDETVLPTGPMSSHFGAFLAPEWRQQPWTVPVFQAMVYAQCMHYAAVIHVLPRLAPDRVGWPAFFSADEGRFFRVSLGLGALLFAGFATSFATAKGIYSLPAGVHAWVEVPLLMLAVGASGHRQAAG